jgi:hypothetical protein
MIPANPYQPPVVPCQPEEADYPADGCPQCGAPFTYWQAARAPTPFAFRCPGCRTRIRIRTPHMKWFFYVGGFVIMIVGGSAMGAGLCYFDWPFLAVALPVLGATWLALEWITYRMIRAYGRFSLPMK